MENEKKNSEERAENTKSFDHEDVYEEPTDEELSDAYMHDGWPFKNASEELDSQYEDFMDWKTEHFGNKFYPSSMKVVFNHNRPQLSINLERNYVYHIFECDWGQYLGRTSLFKDFSKTFEENNKLSDGSPRYEIVKAWSKMINPNEEDNAGHTYEVGYILYKEYLEDY